MTKRKKAWSNTLADWRSPVTRHQIVGANNASCMPPCQTQPIHTPHIGTPYLCSAARASVCCTTMQAAQLL